MGYRELTHGMNSSEPYASVVPGMHTEGLKSFIYLQCKEVSVF